ncbi:MAG: DUF2452 domain-containing protein [Saprospiraceae bacterium]|nr:DUF2452 domain-containing protein [Saprospiraceae bacterium]
MRKENPIDKDKIAETPHLLPYAHHVGSAIIRPIDKGKEKGLSMTAMYQQTDVQLTQIKEQVETLIRQAQEIHDRIDISEKIYKADVGFRPIIGRTYHLYEKEVNQWVISMIAPEEWGKNPPYTFLATVTMLADHTWEVQKKSDTYMDRFNEE